jgi:hypothetical protein
MLPSALEEHLKAFHGQSDRESHEVRVSLEN